VEEKSRAIEGGMMNCPKCEGAITKPERYCGACGHNFGVELHDKFKFYFGLKDELEKLKELQNSLYSGIANVSARMQRYEEVLIRDLERMTVSPTSPSPKTARKKTVRAKAKRR
jgi:hypothetical protein